MLVDCDSVRKLVSYALQEFSFLDKAQIMSILGQCTQSNPQEMIIDFCKRIHNEKPDELNPLRYLLFAVGLDLDHHEALLAVLEPGHANTRMRTLNVIELESNSNKGRLPIRKRV